MDLHVLNLFILLIDIDSSNTYSLILDRNREICCSTLIYRKHFLSEDKTENKLFNNIKVQKYPQAMLN